MYHAHEMVRINESGEKNYEPIIHPQIVIKWEGGRVREIPSAVWYKSHHDIIE
jgi:hypothetical protein